MLCIRNDKKYLISIADYYKSSAYIGCFIAEDPHNGLTGYKVRSLYFDTVYDTDHFEKESGVEQRRKIRLRIYDPKDQFALLEMKQKQGANQLKRSLKISREDANRLINGDFSPLLSYSEEFAKEMYGFMTYRQYRYKTIVEYSRRAFIAKENKTEFTFDQDIRFHRKQYGLVFGKFTYEPVMDLYNVFLSQIQWISFGRVYQACVKRY